MESIAAPRTLSSSRNIAGPTTLTYSVLARGSASRTARIAAWRAPALRSPLAQWPVRRRGPGRGLFTNLPVAILVDASPLAGASTAVMPVRAIVRLPSGPKACPLHVHAYLLCFPRVPTRSSYSLPPTSRPALQCST